MVGCYFDHTNPLFLVPLEYTDTKGKYRSCVRMHLGLTRQEEWNFCKGRSNKFLFSQVCLPDKRTSRMFPCRFPEGQSVSLLAVYGSKILAGALYLMSFSPQLQTIQLSPKEMISGLCSLPRLAPTTLTCARDLGS